MTTIQALFRGTLTRALAMAFLAIAAVLGVVAAPALAQVSNPPAPPANIIVFPQRDFVSASGYAPDDRVIVRVIHDPAVYPLATGGTTDPALPFLPTSTDPTLPAGADGVVEVNHPGGACWFGQTPDIRPGDKVQIQVVAGTNAGRLDETTVRNIVARRPVSPDGVSIVVHGTAHDSFSAIAGNPLPVAELEQRIVAPGNLFQLNGRRTLRATSVAGATDGILSYDPVDPVLNPNGINWTATFSGMSAADVTLALGAESRGMWLGPTLTETSVYEIGPLTFGGPTAPCTAPLEVLPPPPGSETVPPTAPADLTASIDNSNAVTLNWTAATDNVGVTAYAIYRNGAPIFTVSNADGSAPAPTTFIDRNTPPGTYTFEVRAMDAVGNLSPASNVAGPVTAVQQVDVNTFPVNDPPSLPINIIAFPSRDFISPSGYLDDDRVTVQVLRKNAAGAWVIVSSADGITPIGGFAEVNHPGGACWEGVTPELRVGDRVRTIAYNPASVGPGNPQGIRSIDQTTIAGVTAFRPVVVQPDDPATPQNDGIVEIHGTALGADGQPIPIDQIEQRMIATHGTGLWDLNGRRALRAASAAADGTLSYDTVDNPMGIKWTARYTGLDAADVARFSEADTRIHWLGRDPLLLAEATIFENADGNPPGPAGPGCSRPLEDADVTPPSKPGNFTAVFQPAGNQVNLSWTSSSDDWTVAGYRIFLDGVAVANTGPDATSFVLKNLVPGTHAIGVAAFDTASPRGPGATIIEQLIAGFGNTYGNLSEMASVGALDQPDVTTPSVPVNLVAVSGVGQVALTWSPSSDDVGVTRYNVYRNGYLVASVPGTAYLDTGLALGDYTYTVSARDAAGNQSAQSAPALATVLAVPDLTPPTVPTNVLASTSPDVHGRDVSLTWTTSTDDIGVTGYGIYRSAGGAAGGSPTLIATVNGTTFSYLDVNLPAGSYTYTVDAVDSSANRSAASAPTTAIVANDPPIAPHSLIAFPARDFISATGYTPGGLYRFELIRGAQTFVSSADIVADATGLIEVNHPGGQCWVVNTPNMRAGDVIRIVDVATGVADQTTVANVTADRPIAINANTVVIHGTAADAAGNPLPIGQVEHRLISSTALAFQLNGRRALTTANDGTLAYDAPGSTRWTATYTNLSATDMLIAVGGTGPTGTVFVGAESRGMWLGRVPLSLTEATIYENGTGVTGGPSAPCTAPAETPVAAASLSTTALAFANTKFSPAPVATSAPQTVVFSNGGASPLTLTNIYFAGLNPGDFARTGSCPTAFPATLAAGASCTVTVTFKPTALGQRQASLNFSGNQANTTDLAVTLRGAGFDSSAPLISVTPSPVPFGTINGGGTGTQTLTLRNTNLVSVLTLDIASMPITGTAGTDFTRTGGTCATTFPIQIASGGSCTVVLSFKPGAPGARAGTLTLNHNAAPVATSTAISLTGTGGTGSVLTINSNPVTFGTVTRNTTKDQTVTIKNSGTAAATLNLASFTVTGAGYSKVSTTCATLAVNNSCNVVVRYAAPAGAGGPFAGTLSVTAANGLPTVVTTNLTASSK